MVMRLRDILGKLYCPPADGPRQLFALSRFDSHKLPKLRSIAVVSITAPDSPPDSIGYFAHALRLNFAYVDFLNPDLSARAREKIIDAFTEEHAEAIDTFIDTLPDEIRSIIVHCDGG